MADARRTGGADWRKSRGRASATGTVPPAGIETVTIASLGHEGDGIAETAAGRVFVAGALPGETVEIARTGERGELQRVLSPSPDRIAPPCPHFGVCGGCALQHLATPAYAEWKRELLTAAFAQRGIAVPPPELTLLEPGSRRRVVFAVERGRSGTRLGFRRARSHELVAIRECPVAMPAIAGRPDLLRAVTEAVLRPGASGRLTVLAADTGLDLAFETESPASSRGGRERGGREPAGRATVAGAPFPPLPPDPALARVTRDGEIVFLDRQPEIRIDPDARLLPPPGAFLQASATAEAVMAGAVTAAAAEALALHPRAVIADLFAGIGTFSLRLAELAPVLAVEGDAAATAALNAAARQARGRKPVTVRRRDLVHNPLAPPELDALAAVVFDPPRAGAAAQAAMLAQSKVPVVVAVSCNPATLARDARTLLDGGYRLASLIGIDQFLWSAHVEAVAVFRR